MLPGFRPAETGPTTSAVNGWWCPRGDGPLVMSADNGVHETCDACHGFCVTVWLLGEMLVEGAGGAVWRSSETATTKGDPCPACRNPMVSVAAPAGPAGTATIEVCRNCELVWVSAAAAQLLPVRPDLAQSAGVTSPDPTHCPNCGAPYSETADGRCTYCHAVVPRPQFDLVAPLLAQLDAIAHADGRRSSGMVESYMEAEAESTRRSF